MTQKGEGPISDAELTLEERLKRRARKRRRYMPLHSASLRHTGLVAKRGFATRKSNKRQKKNPSQ